MNIAQPSLQQPRYLAGIGDGIPPKKTNCDDDEQPATFQDWNRKGPG